MTAAIAAGLGGNADIAGINKANKLPTLAGQQRVSAFRICASVLAIALPFGGKLWPDVRLVFRPFDILRIFTRLSRDGIAAVAAGAGQSNRILAVFQFVERFGGAVFVHRLDLAVARDAAFEFRR